MSAEVLREDHEQSARFRASLAFGSSKDTELERLLQREAEGDIDVLSYLFAAYRHQAEEAMRERAAGECVKYRLQCDMVAVQRSRDGEGSDAAIVCSLAAELLERTIRSIDTRGE
ncbi:hypothetical protein [Sphingomonas aquatilis]